MGKSLRLISEAPKYLSGIHLIKKALASVEPSLPSHELRYENTHDCPSAFLRGRRVNWSFHGGLLLLLALALAAAACKQVHGHGEEPHEKRESQRELGQRHLKLPPPPLLHARHARRDLAQRVKQSDDLVALERVARGASGRRRRQVVGRHENLERRAHTQDL